MGALSNYTAKKLLDSLTSGSIGNLWFALYNTDPTASNTGVEVSGGGYGRVRIQSMTSASLIGGKMTSSNTEKVSLPRATGTWTTANYWAILDSQVGGNLLVKEALLVSVSITSGQQPEFDAGALVITLE